MHASMRDRRRGIWGAQQHIHLGLVAPPCVPFRFVRLPLGDELPLLESATFAELVEKICPEGIAPYVFGVEVVQVFDGARERDVEGHTGGAGVGAFTGAEEGEEGAAAVGVEEGGGE
ncbi:MAG: hypothetical protein Q9207_005021, partial [Kuettlingeria erythrocarpa]